MASSAAWACLVLVGLTVAVYWPVWRFDFLTFDDPVYVAANPHVAAGLAWSGIAWAFTSAHAGFWIPLTWLSFMTEAQAFGVNAGVSHATNLVLHVIAALLLFRLLLLLTGSTGRSLLVAALFAVHPLHVESVAWVTERKDVLSAVFVFLALNAYVQQVRAPSAWRRAVTAGWFACGIMAKPVVVSLPVLLVLLDVWPLGRLAMSRRTDADRASGAAAIGWATAIAEKWSLWLMAAAAAVVVFITQRGAGAVGESGAIAPLVRLNTAVTACALYLWKTAWPAGLSAFYPYRFSVDPWLLGVSLAVVVGSTAAVLRLRHRPCLLVGWLWFIVTLLPVLGLVQVGNQAMADRFTYLPLVGIFVILAWGVPELTARVSRWTAAAAALAVGLLAVVAHGQVAAWQNDETLWTHAVTVDPSNYFAHNGIGRVLYARGEIDAAAPHFAEAVRLNPSFYDSHQSLGIIFLGEGRVDAAIEQLREAARLKPTAESLASLGAALAQGGDLAGAERYGRQAVDLDPTSPEAHFDLGLTLARLGRADAATGEFLSARRLNPGLASVDQALGESLLRQGRLTDAEASFRAATRQSPGSAEAFHGLGQALSGLERLDEAIVAFGEAVRLSPQRGEYEFDLGVSLAASGKPGEAIPYLAEAARLTPTSEQAHYYLGAALAAAGRFEEARVPLAEVLRLNPGNEAARRAILRLPRG